MKSILKSGGGDLGWIADFGHSRDFTAGKVPVSPRIISKACGARVPLCRGKPLEYSVRLSRGQRLEHDGLRLEPFAAELGTGATLLNRNLIVLMGRNRGQELNGPRRCRADLVEPQVSLSAETYLDRTVARGHDHTKKVDCPLPGVIGAAVSLDCPPPYSASSQVRFKSLLGFLALIFSQVKPILFAAVKDRPIPGNTVLVAKVESWRKKSRHELVYESVRLIRQCWNSLYYQKLDHFLRPLPCTMGGYSRAHLCQGSSLAKAPTIQRISNAFDRLTFTKGHYTLRATLGGAA